jgi:uncharacterized protein YndB with AHSA1/START domain
VEIGPGTSPDTVTVRTVLTTTLSPPPAELWPVLTRPEELLRWYGPVLGELAPGGEFTVAGGGGEVLTAAAPHELRLAWGPRGARSPLAIRLDPEDDGTTALQIAHEVTLATATFDTYGPGAWAVGWDIALLGLAAHTGGWSQGLDESVPAPDATWLTSGQGADFVRAWSIRWAAASVAAGTADADARRGEIATCTAYGVPHPSAATTSTRGS